MHQNVMTITQNILYAFKSECQVQYKPKNEESLFCHRYEWPQLLAVAIAVHKATRSKKLIQFLHGFALSVDYSHILRIETKLASYVLDKIALEGAYVPPCIGKGRFIFFAIDNSDFNEDTLDGKRTLHATATAVYQQEEKELKEKEIDRIFITGSTARERSLKELPGNMTELIPCHVPANTKPKSPVFENFRGLYETTSQS